jgi:hypothetical protein
MPSATVNEDSGRSERGARVRQAFRDQAGYCDRLGSPFTATLCRVLADGLDGSTDIERYILEWPGNPSPIGDSVALRVAGALNYLVRAGRVPELAEQYPPHTVTEPATLLATARAALLEHPSFVRDFLRSPPQTNEVGRSAALIAGFLEIAARTRLPLSLFEIGSSAGLNLIADRYAYRFGDLEWTPAPQTGSVSPGQLSAPTLACGWTGRGPDVHAPLRVQSRRGCDLHPVSIVDPAQRERLVAYVWADQNERIDRLNAAIGAMLREPVSVERSDAADWVQIVLPPSNEPGTTRVLFHSIVWSYLDSLTQQRIANHLAEIGAASTRDNPLAWLRLELAGKDEPAALLLTLWPGGEEEVLARVHPHGAWIRWAERS